MLRRFLCGLAQAVALPFILALMTAQWLGIFVSYMLLSGENSGFSVELLIAARRLHDHQCGDGLRRHRRQVAGPRPHAAGPLPAMGRLLFRWWLIAAVARRSIHAKWFQGSPVMRLYLRALGANVGRDALIAEIECGAVDLVSIGAGASIGAKVEFANAEVIGNELVIGTIDVGAEAYVGTSCVIGHNVVIGESAELGDLTTVAPGTPRRRRRDWDGSPGRKRRHGRSRALPEPPTASRARTGCLARRLPRRLLALPPVSLLPIFPAFWVFDRIDDYRRRLRRR